MDKTDFKKVNMALEEVPSIAAEPSEGQKVKKHFNFWTAFGIAICTSGAWEGWTSSIAQGITGGSSVGLFWGWIFVSVGIVCMASSLAEFVSMWPSSGGQYVWVANLAPARCSRLLSWITAWISLIGLWLGAISCSMGVANQIQAYAIVACGYNPQRWHAFLINVACIIWWILVNIFTVRFLHYLNQGVLVLHVVAFFVVIGVLAGCTKDMHDAKYVFTDFQNETGWKSDFVSWSISLLPALYAFFSLDTASHYSEEITGANVFVPRAMMLQAVANAVTTIPLIITVIFAIGDASAVLASPIGQMSPFTQVLINSTGNVGAGIFLNVPSTILAMTAGFDLWGGAARAIWSMARDNALPPMFARLHPRWEVPIWGNLILVPPSLIVCMIYIWNTTAFYGIMAGVLVAFQLSYVIPIGVNLFYTRWKKNLIKGPFDLGRFGVVLNIIAFIFGCFVTFFMAFPVYNPVSPANMNYGSAIVGAVVILSMFVWFFYGSKHYVGPVTFVAAERCNEDMATLEPETGLKCSGSE